MPTSLPCHGSVHAATPKPVVTRRPRRALTTALAIALAVPLLTAGPSSAAPTVPVPATPVVLPMDNVLSVTMYTRTSVNVRSGPSTSHSVVGGYAKGTKVTGTWTSNGWLHLGNGRYVAGSVLVSTPPSTGDVTRYTRTSVNVRSGPSTSHSVVGGYPKGTKVTGTWTNGWLHIGNGRYVAGTVLVSTPPESSTEVTRYTRTSVNVRSGPSTSHSVVGGHAKGTELTGTLTSNGWLQTSASRYVAGSVLVTEDPTDNVSGSAILAEAEKYAGIMYRYGGTSPSTGFDCSGYTQYVFGQLGISLPRSAAAQQSYATPVSSPQPGDLVFWGSPAYHVGIYAGGGQIWDSGKPGIPVQKRNIFSGVSGYGRVN
ncbi:C40 family peptidase [Ornithinimicrobium cryptoxanthini]|uniref:C40 family peptidase n=1 Tax=Ornithinimicrobium cryptoxanthini TaxID=2934161 RepID=UPI002119A620|nr:SH3 domain-containing protein [Ornithinimicrobium cryptoxanthini]